MKITPFAAPRPRIDQADGTAAPERPSASQPFSRSAAAGPSELGHALPTRSGSGSDSDSGSGELRPRAALPPGKLKVPDLHHFVWVGPQLPQGDLLTAQHLAARGGQVTVWTDQPGRAMATATSLHSPQAGSLDTSISLSIGDRGRAGRYGLRLMHVDQAFNTAAASPVEAQLTRRLDALQAIEGAGGGNPAARSDVVRYQVLHQEGGVYMDFDRAESIRPDLWSDRRQGTYPPLQGDVTVPLVGLSTVRLPQHSVSGLVFNNDMLASQRSSPGITEVRRQVVLGYVTLGLQAPFHPTDRPILIIKSLPQAYASLGQQFLTAAAMMTLDLDMQKGLMDAQGVLQRPALPLPLHGDNRLAQSRAQQSSEGALAQLHTTAVKFAGGPEAVRRAIEALGLQDAEGTKDDPADGASIQARYSATHTAMQAHPDRGSWLRGDPAAGEAVAPKPSHEAP